MPTPRAHDSDPRRLGYYGTSRHFRRVRRDLLRSVAYLCLSPSARLILLDWIGRYETDTNYETNIRMADAGLPYSHANCSEPVSRSTFYRALAELRAKKFLEPHPKYLRETGEKIRWRPSHGWLAYAPSDDELRTLAAYQSRRSPAYTGQRRLDTDAIEYTDGIDAARALEITGTPDLSRAVFRRAHRPERTPQ